MRLITDTAALAAFCRREAGSDFLAVDTEFLRDKTYWPVLCLVQIAGAGEAVAVDALAPEIDLTPLLDLMADAPVRKVFHAARQDMEIFHHLGGRLPSPIFDTQVAAMVCGFGDSVGYDKLVARLAGKRIDKSLRFTDWSRRPLSEKMLDYAMSDVIHLRVVYEKLAGELDRSGRETWLAAEMAVLTDPATYRQEPGEAWRRIKTRMRNPRHLAILRALAAWREEEAQTRNLPRNRIVRDETIAEIAAHEPETPDELFKLRGLSHQRMGGRTAERVLEIVRAARASPERDWPRAEPADAGAGRPGPAVELLKVLLKLKCEEHRVAQKLVASADDVEAIARDDDADVPALHGWRRELYGADALALKRGELALTADGRKVRVLRRDG